MKNLFLASAAMALIGASGCASMDNPNDATVKANQTVRTAKEYATGSRLAKPTTPHMVKSVGNDEYNQYNEHKSLGNVVGAKSN
ncbi:MAG: hypothetical protein JNJ55_07130 [Betaproteobacteria bacterium]|nr:hypothetical protein [Betaproteobacteria bacterium]